VRQTARDDLEELELQLLLEGVFRRYGFDFREYAPASLRRRIWRRVHAEGEMTIVGLLERLLHDPASMERLLLDLSINVTSMFRDPTFYVAFRQRVIPLLRTYPFTRIWVAGCSTGEEVYSSGPAAASFHSTRCRSTRRTTSAPEAPARSPSTTSPPTTAPSSSVR
jgi:chemotaxis methyl-accepting protein methylase